MCFSFWILYIAVIQVYIWANAVIFEFCTQNKK